MADNGDLGGGEAADQRGARAAALDFDGLRAGIFHEADGVAGGFARGGVVGAVGHVRDEEGVAQAAGNRAGVVQHLVESNGEGIFVAENDHAQRVADQHHVDARLVDQTGGRIVIRGDCGDGMPAKFLLQEEVGGDAWEG